MCKQKTVLNIIKQTKDLPEWFVMHAEAQAEDFSAAVERDKKTMEQVESLDKRMTSMESKLDVVASNQTTMQAQQGAMQAQQGAMQAQLTEVIQLIRDNNMKEKVWVFDGFASFFKGKFFKVAILLALGFLVGAGKDVVMAAFGLL